MIELFNIDYKSLHKKIIITIILIVMGTLGNSIHFPLFFGINFQLGSIPILILLYTYGLPIGIIGTVISNFYSFMINGHPYSLIVATVEIIFIGLFLKRNRVNIILVDCLFWISIGMFTNMIITTQILNFNISETIYDLLKNSLNGIFNAFCASSIIFYISTRRWYAGLNKEKTIPVNEIFLNIIIGTVLVSDLFISLLNAKGEKIPLSYELQQYYIKNLSIILLSVLLTILITVYICKFLTSPMINLAEVTTHLPSKIFNEQSIKWPKSFVREIDSITNNFKNSSIILKESFNDIQKVNSELKYLANHDPLTRLTNRVVFNNELDKAIEHSKSTNKKLAIMFLDVDRFKLINDTFGHSAGDQLLIEISKRLLEVLGDKDIVCRMGGDEFTFLISNLEKEEEAAIIAKDILDSLQKTYFLEDQEFNISASMGIAFYPQDGDKTDVLLKKADIAMYRAKENCNSNFEFYNSDMDNQGLERFKMENHLRRALEKEELVLHYQPRVDSETEVVKAVEALIRWNSPTFGMVPPIKFIPLAEEIGIIVPIGEWVLKTACKQNKAWQESGYKPFRVSVNLSALQFAQRNLVDRIGAILEETGLQPEWLELEITEGIIIKDIEFTIKTLERLKDMGVKVSLDDFGTGFSSLNYLKNFKIDTLKIDSSFVRDINGDNKNTAIVNTIINLGKNLDLNVTAEGVETTTQLNFLKLNGCNEIQGYLYSRPIPPEELEMLVKEENLFIGGIKAIALNP